MQIPKVHRKRKRIESAYATNIISRASSNEEPGYEEDNNDNDPQLSMDSYSPVKRKKKSAKSEEAIPCYPEIPVKVRSKRNTKKTRRLTNPKIVEAIVEAETVCRCSMDSAIRVIHLCGNRLLGQQWLLPLSMDEEYIKDTKKLTLLESTTPGKGESVGTSVEGNIGKKVDGKESDQVRPRKDQENEDQSVDQNVEGEESEKSMGSKEDEDQTVDQNIEGKESEKAMTSKDQGVEDQSEEKYQMNTEKTKIR